MSKLWLWVDRASFALFFLFGGLAISMAIIERYDLARQAGALTVMCLAVGIYAALSRWPDK